MKRHDLIMGAMTHFLRDRRLLLFLRLALGFIFIISAIAKLTSQTDFVEVVAGYGILSGIYAEIFGLILPWAELILGVLLVVGLWLRITAAAALLMVSSFLIANLSAILHQGNPGESCGCFGTVVSLSNTGSLVFDIVMLLALALLLTTRAVPPARRITGRLLRYSHAVNIIMAVVLLVPSVASASYTIPAGTSELNVPVSGNAEDLLDISHDDNEIKSFIDQALADDKTALLYFYSAACGYCQQQSPIIDELESEHSTAAFLRIANDEAAFRQFKVTGFPTIIIITGKNKDGHYYHQRFNGLTSKDVLESALLEASPESGTGSLLLDNFSEPVSLNTLDPETLAQLEGPGPGQ